MVSSPFCLQLIEGPIEEIFGSDGGFALFLKEMGFRDWFKKKLTLMFQEFSLTIIVLLSFKKVDRTFVLSVEKLGEFQNNLKREFLFKVIFREAPTKPSFKDNHICLFMLYYIIHI